MNVLGTVRFNGKNLPEELRKLEKGNAIAMSQDDGCKVAGQKNTCYHSENSTSQQYLGGAQERQAGKQGNQSRNQCLSFTMAKVWWGLIEWNSTLHHNALICCYQKVCRIFPSLSL